MKGARPFRIDVSDDTLARIADRVAAYRWFDPPEGDAWQRGMSTPALKDVVDYWRTEYDWRAAEADLNRFDHFKAEIDGLGIHFVHVVGEAGGKRPLLLSHGWPGSIYEFWDVIDPLAFPSRHGGDPADAFDLVIPSLPGYGFSGKPKALVGQRATAELWDTLMRGVLGYRAYLAQGGDWGGLVTSWLGLNHDIQTGKGGCRAIHLNFMGFRPTPGKPETEEEARWLAHTSRMMQAEGAYLMMQGTKPQTLALALMDTPVGQAAWILEKFHAWSDLGAGDLWGVYSRDQLLTNIMIYLVNDAFATSVWYYRAFFEDGRAALPEGVRCETPTGFANYPGERVFPMPPRSWCERAYNVTYWQDQPKGGHFAAMEAPALFVDDIRNWARTLAED